MSAPFYNCVKGTTAGTPGTGAFTPNAASTGLIAWSTVPTGWSGMVRYEDGSAWSLEYCYWNGTTLSRASTQVAQAGGVLLTSSGAHLTLTSAATAAMVIDPAELAPHFGNGLMRGWIGVSNVTSAPTPIGVAAVTVTGTAASATLASTSFLTEQQRSSTASATTANAQAGYSGGALYLNSVTSTHGGWEFTCRFGASTTLPTSPRLFVGVSSVTFIAVTSEPSALVSHVACFAKDSTDTNIQLLTNDNSGNGTKIDTGIALVAGGWYESTVWMEPGGGRVYALLVRLDTGAIWLGSTTTDIPGAATLRPHCIGGLSATTGTAFTMDMGTLIVRQGQ
jgi:hypothetical protein